MGVRVDLEWSQGVIRCGGDAFLGPVPGTRYDFVVSIFKKGSEAYLYGGCGQFSKAAYREIVRVLKASGIKQVTWERLNMEKARRAQVEL